MSFINTIDQLGDDVVLAGFIEKSITEFNDNVITTIGSDAFYFNQTITSLKLLGIEQLGQIGNCDNLTSIKLSNETGVELSLGYQTFYNLNALTTLDIGCNCQILEIFNLCTNISQIILRYNGICRAVNKPTLPITCYIYVPRALKDQYVNETNWTTVSNQFRILEDFTVDGTTTGELDLTKI